MAARVTKADADAAEAGFKWAIHKAYVMAPEPLWMELSRREGEIRDAWWATVPKLQLVQCKERQSTWPTRWRKGYVALAKKDGLAGWYIIDGLTTKGEEFEFSALESR